MAVRKKNAYKHAAVERDFEMSCTFQGLNIKRLIMIMTKETEKRTGKIILEVLKLVYLSTYMLLHHKTFK